MLDISVLMPVYNTEIGVLQLAIDSILAQSFKDYKFFIINDGSNRECTDFLNSLPTLDNRIQIYHNDSNLGLTKTLNKSLQLIKSKFIARMDSDDFALKNRLEEQIHFLIKHPHVDIVGSQALSLENNSPISVPSKYEDIRANLLFKSTILHPTVIYNKERILDIGGYTNNQFAEDYGLWIKAVYFYGLKVENLNQPLLKYRTFGRSKKYLEIQRNSAQEIQLKAISRLTNINFNINDISNREILEIVKKLMPILTGIDVLDKKTNKKIRSKILKLLLQRQRFKKINRQLLELYLSMS